MQRRDFIKNSAVFSLAASTPQKLRSVTSIDKTEERTYWIETMLKIADPVLEALVNKKLKSAMPVEARSGKEAEREKVTHLEAVSRLYSGMAPWLALGEDASEEGKLRGKYAELVRQGLSSIVDPDSPNFLNFTGKEGNQPLVDAATLAHALIRAPQQLISKLDEKSRKNLAAALKNTREIRPHFNNWLLFSAMIEAALKKMDEDWDAVRIDYALRTVAQWYLGDGMYGDGPDFHWDYYNSLVIHPWLLDILEVLDEQDVWYKEFYQKQVKRAQRYGEILERLISPEGTYPAIGRSLAYRFGAFHALSHLAMKKMLSDKLSPAQVRSGLTAVIQRTMQAPDTFDKNGWLTIGFYGHQPAIAESYISTGSLYACALVFLPLGLPQDDPFWASPSENWTAKKVWSGENIPNDKHI